MQPVSRPIQRGGRSQAIRNHRRFVENRDLDQNKRETGFAQNRRGKGLAKQPACGLLKNIDPDQNQKAATDKQKPAEGGEQADLASDSEEFQKTQAPTPVTQSLPVCCPAHRMGSRLKSVFQLTKAPLILLLSPAFGQDCLSRRSGGWLVQATEPLIRATRMDSTLTLNPKSTASTTNKLQQIVSGFE